jgi:glycosyltransferase involved in cell wall biosynthesis
MTYKILALEPFYGGSHKAFLDDWQQRSRHSFTVLGLPDKFWRWRMRHSASYFARQLREEFVETEKWDIIFCSDMLNLAEFIGLAPPALRQLPTIVFFHENQLAYPVHDATKRDSNAILSNFSSALAASEVWFNSCHNRDTLLDGLPAFFQRMPDHRPVLELDLIREKSVIMPLGISLPQVIVPVQKVNKPLHILWAARWEHDKNPEDFFAALQQLKQHGADFKLSVIGESPARIPAIFTNAKQEFKEHIINWGYMPSRAEYERVLVDADVVVSTAIHEFFGIGILEAVAAGAYPVLPKRLAYPEIFNDGIEPYQEFFYGQNATELADKLFDLINIQDAGADIFAHCQVKPQTIAEQYSWEKCATRLDRQLATVIKTHSFNLSSAIQGCSI